MTTITLYPDRVAGCWMAHWDDEAARLAHLDLLATPWSTLRAPEHVRRAIQDLNPRANVVVAPGPPTMCKITHRS